MVIRVTCGDPCNNTTWGVLKDAIRTGGVLKLENAAGKTLYHFPKEKSGRSEQFGISASMGRGKDVSEGAFKEFSKILEQMTDDSTAFPALPSSSSTCDQAALRMHLAGLPVSM